MAQKILKHIEDFFSLDQGHPERILSKGNFFIVRYSSIKQITYLIITLNLYILLIDLLFGKSMAELTINRLATSIAVFVVYYFSRDNKRNNVFRIIVFVLAFVSLSIEIFYRETMAVILLPFYMCMLSFLLLLYGYKIKLIIFPLLILNLLVWFQSHEYFHFGIDESDSSKILSIHKGFYSFVTTIGILFILHLTRAMYYNLLKPPQNHNGHNFIYGQTDDETNQIIRKLTIREREIYLMKLKGKTNKEIANILKVDLSTVKTHINNIHKKFVTTEKIKL